MDGFRKNLPRCQYGVWSPSIQGDVECCGEPAVAIWNWGHDDLYVCEYHDETVWDSEETEGVYDRISITQTTEV